MGAHVLAILGQPVPDDYTAVIDALATAGVLTTEFARSFRAMAGFRNVLVHEYLTVDPEVVVGVLHDHLDDFEAFDASTPRSSGRCATAASSRRSRRSRHRVRPRAPLACIDAADAASI